MQAQDRRQRRLGDGSRKVQACGSGDVAVATRGTRQARANRCGTQPAGSWVVRTGHGMPAGVALLEVQVLSTTRMWPHEILQLPASMVGANNKPRKLEVAVH